MEINLVEQGKKYIFTEKFQQWEEATANVSQDVLMHTVEIMKLMETGYNFKKINEVVKTIDDSAREQVVRLLTNYAKDGPEYAYDRLYKSQHGKVDRNNEYVKGLLYKMDENDILKGKEKE